MCDVEGRGSVGGGFVVSVGPGKDMACESGDAMVGDVGLLVAVEGFTAFGPQISRAAGEVDA